MRLKRERSRREVRKAAVRSRLTTTLRSERNVVNCPILVRLVNSGNSLLHAVYEPPKVEDFSKFKAFLHLEAHRPPWAVAREQ
jgi:hypothetical protein